MKHGGGKDRLSEFHSVDNMFYWEWDFYQRHLHKCVGSQSTRQCTGREVVGSQTWFLVRQICKPGRLLLKLTSSIQAKI